MMRTVAISKASRPATIKEVAHMSGVSTATVSYVLNDGPRAVLPETKARVLEAITQLQYHPSTVARSMTRKRLNCLGIVLSTPHPTLMIDPYFSGVLHGIVQTATKQHQNIMLYSGLEWRGAAESLPAYRDRRVDGLILVAPYTDSDIIPALAAAGLPFVCISISPTDRTVMSVDVDNCVGARLATEHLLELGHRRIACLGGPANSPSAPTRRQGYLEAITAAGIVPDASLMCEGPYHESWGFRGTQQLLDLPQPPTAIFAGNDSVALGAYHACAEAGVCVPGQMSIVGFDDTTLAEHMTPPLTTVQQPLTQMGSLAATLLLDYLKGVTPSQTQSILPTSLVVRSSTSLALIHSQGELN